MRSTAEGGREGAGIDTASSVAQGKAEAFADLPLPLFLLLDQLVVVGCFPIENSRLRLREREGEGVEEEVGRSWNLGMGRGRRRRARRGRDG